MVKKNRVTWNQHEVMNLISMPLLLSWLWQKMEEECRSFTKLLMFKHTVGAHQMVITIIP